MGGNLRPGRRLLAAAPGQSPGRGTGGGSALIRIARLLAKPALLLCGLLLAGLALRGGWGRAALDAPAEAGPVVFVLVGTLACAVGVPRQVVAYAAGLGFGAWLGCLLALVAEVGGCLADFLWARLVARGWAARRITGRLARLDRQLSRHPFSATLTLRLLPMGSNILLNLLAGVSAVSLMPFLLASTLGYVPQTIIFALLGGGVRVDRTEQLVVAAVLFVAASLLGVWLMRRMGADRQETGSQPVEVFLTSHRALFVRRRAGRSQGGGSEQEVP